MLGKIYKTLAIDFRMAYVHRELRKNCLDYHLCGHEEAPCFRSYGGRACVALDWAIADSIESMTLEM